MMKKLFSWFFSWFKGEKGEKGSVFRTLIIIGALVVFFVVAWVVQAQNTAKSKKMYEDRLFINEAGVTVLNDALAVTTEPDLNQKATKEEEEEAVPEEVVIPDGYYQLTVRVRRAVAGEDRANLEDDIIYRKSGVRRRKIQTSDYEYYELIDDMLGVDDFITAYYKRDRTAEVIIHVFFGDVELEAGSVVEDVNADAYFVVADGEPTVETLRIIGRDLSGLTVKVERPQYGTLEDYEDEGLWLDSHRAYCSFAGTGEVLISFPGYPELLAGEEYVLPCVVLTGHGEIVSLGQPILAS